MLDLKVVYISQNLATWTPITAAKAGKYCQTGAQEEEQMDLLGTIQSKCIKSMLKD